MAIKIRNILKSFFTTGAKPTQSQFADFIDSFFHRTEDANQPGGVPLLDTGGKIPPGLLDLLAYAKRKTVVIILTESTLLTAAHNDALLVYWGATDITVTATEQFVGFGCVLAHFGDGRINLAAAASVTLEEELNRFRTVKKRPASLVFVSNTIAMVAGTAA